MPDSSEGQHNTLRKVQDNSTVSSKGVDAISDGSANRSDINPIPVHSHSSMAEAGPDVPTFGKD
jgi:hypothetical protein